MIAWDTNFLIRYLITDDDTKQTEVVLETLADQQKAGTPIFITQIVICESIWVLSGAYKIPKPQLIQILESLLADSNFHFENAAILPEALEMYKSQKGDLSDYLIGLTAKLQAKVEATHSFDKALSKCDLFETH